MHEFGASLGGPIMKGKWFYFFNYEGIRDRVGNPGVTDSPVTVSLANQMGGIANSDGSPNSALYSVPDAIAYFNNPNNVAYCQANFDSSSACAVNPLSLQLSSCSCRTLGSRCRRVIQLRSTSISSTKIAATTWSRKLITF